MENGKWKMKNENNTQTTAKFKTMTEFMSSFQITNESTRFCFVFENKTQTQTYSKRENDTARHLQLKLLRMNIRHDQTQCIKYHAYKHVRSDDLNALHSETKTHIDLRNSVEINVVLI